MNEREATQRLMRARARLTGPEKLSPEDLIEAANELAAARAVLPKRRAPDLVLSALEAMVEELDRFLDGDEEFPEVWPPAVFAAGGRDKLVSARQLLREVIATRK
jgi:hypothetical protein